MRSVLQQLLVTLLVTLAVTAYSGIFTTVLAVADQLAAPSTPSGCCAQPHHEERQAPPPCGQDDCHCPCCLTAELPAFPLVLAPAATAVAPYADLTTALRGETFRSIDYPPEAA